MPRRGPRRRPLAEDSGFTLIELLVAASVSLLVLGGMVMLLTSVLRSQPENEERAAQIQEARVVLERTVRELRQGKAVAGIAGTSTQITVDAFTRAGCDGASPTASAVICRVTYACSGAAGEASCTRKAGTAPPETLLSGLASADVFSYGSTTSPSCDLSTIGVPSLVCIKLAYLGSDDSEAVTAEDSAYLRNPPA